MRITITPGKVERSLNVEMDDYTINNLAHATVTLFELLVQHLIEKELTPEIIEQLPLELHIVGAILAKIEEETR